MRRLLPFLAFLMLTPLPAQPVTLMDGDIVVTDAGEVFGRGRSQREDVYVMPLPGGAAA